MNRKDFISRMGVFCASAVVTPIVLKASVRQAESKRVAKKIRVGIIGCGSVSGVYLPHLSKSPYAEVVSLCDIKIERARQRAERFNIKNYYPNINEMLSGVPFELLLNLTDMQQHGLLNRQALMAKKYVWSEKPMANTYKEGRALYELAIKQGVRIWGAPAVVNSPQFAFMAKQINAKSLGRIAAVHAHYGHDGPDWSAFFYEKDGGSLPDLGVYNISSLTGLLGPAKSLVAMTNVVTPERKVRDKGQIKVVAEDNSMIILEHQNNILSHIQCGFNYFNPHGHDGSGEVRPTISIIGSEGNMNMIGYDWQPLGVELATVKNPKLQLLETDSKGFQWQEGASAICEYLSTGKEPLIDAEHALHVLEIIEATRLSQQQGKRIQLKSNFKWPIIT